MYCFLIIKFLNGIVFTGNSIIVLDRSLLSTYTRVCSRMLFRVKCIFVHVEADAIVYIFLTISRLIL